MKNLNNLNLIPLKANYFEKFIVLFFPISILLGNFMIDFTLTLIAIYFLFISIRYKLLSYYKNIFAYAFFSIYFIILINGIISDDVKESLLNNEGAIFYFRYFFFTSCLIYFFKKDNQLLKIFAIVLFFTIFIIVIDGYIQYFYDQNILGFKKFTSTRLTSVFYNEPILGSYLLKIVPLMLSIIFYFFSNNFKIVILSYIFLGFVEVLIFMSGDRTPLLSITIFAFIIILCSNNFRFLRLITFFFSIIAMLALYNYNDSSKNRVLETLDQISYNEMNFKFMPITYYHDRLFMTSLSMYNDHKILGIGSNLFRSKCPEYNEDLSECNSHPHNYYFQILAENGLVGFFSMVLIFLFFLKKLTFHFFSLFAQRFKKFNLKDHQLIIVALILVNLNPFFLTQSFYNQWSVPLIFLPFAFYFFFSINKT